MSAVIGSNPPGSAAAEKAAKDAERAAEKAVKDEAGSTTVPGAIERLALSRERLREAMLPTRRRSRERPIGEGVGQGIGQGIGDYASSLVERVRAMPAVNLVVEALQDWWARHPLHSAGLVAAEASRRLAAPVAERRPLVLLFGAVLVGALLALVKPWRFLLRPALFAGLVPALLARGVRELPIEHWLQVAAGLAAPRPATRDADDEARAAAARAAAAAAVPPVPTSTTAVQAAALREEPSAVYP